MEMQKIGEKTGFVLIDKPSGPTSHDVVAKLRKITGVKKIGHSGTLDPIASGLLIVGIGRDATKRLGEFLKMDKEYVAKIHLGAVSDTFDREGVVKEQKCSIPEDKRSHLNIPKEERPRNFRISCLTDKLACWRGREGNLPDGKAGSPKTAFSNSLLKFVVKLKIKKVLKKFVGEIKQVPPIFSAKKIGGKKMYELARKGIEVKPKAVKIKIYKIKLLDYEWPFLEIKCKVSSGTYIRSLANDIGKALGCGGYLEELRRTKIDKYIVEDAVNLAKLTSNNWQNFVFKL
jgi:tRNA pseudouridine55 synthase